MIPTSSSPALLPADASAPLARPLREATRLRGAALLRVAFGLVWAVDAALKWMPGFIEGQTLPDELGRGVEVSTPVVHEWLRLWNGIGLADPALSAHVIAVVETLIALLLVTGFLSRTAFIGSALVSLGIWTGAEGMHLPWFRDGQTDLGPSVGYVVASLGLLAAQAGSTWSVDAVLERRARERRAAGRGGTRRG
jgi:thiosulfate dehydrogenase [quinone] large subunit